MLHMQFYFNYYSLWIFFLEYFKNLVNLRKDTSAFYHQMQIKSFDIKQPF